MTMCKRSDLCTQQLQVTLISVFINYELWAVLGYTVRYFSPQSNTEIIYLTEKAPFPSRGSSFSHFQQQDTMRTDSSLLYPTLYVVWAQPGVHLDFCGLHQTGITREFTFWSSSMLLWRRWQFLYACLEEKSNLVFWIWVCGWFNSLLFSPQI